MPSDLYERAAKALGGSVAHDGWTQYIVLPNRGSYAIPAAVVEAIVALAEQRDAATRRVAELEAELRSQDWCCETCTAADRADGYGGEDGVCGMLRPCERHKTQPTVVGTAALDAALAKARREGVEAMREAAAEWCHTNDPDSVAADAICALPLPEAARKEQPK